MSRREVKTAIFPLSPRQRLTIQRTQVKVVELLGIEPGRSGWTPEQIAYAAQSIEELEDERFLDQILALAKADRLT